MKTLEIDDPRTGRSIEIDIPDGMEITPAVIKKIIAKEFGANWTDQRTPPKGKGSLPSSSPSPVAINRKTPKPAAPPVMPDFTKGLAGVGLGMNEPLITALPKAVNAPPAPPKAIKPIAGLKPMRPTDFWTPGPVRTRDTEVPGTRELRAVNKSRAQKKVEQKNRPMTRAEQRINAFMQGVGPTGAAAVGTGLGTPFGPAGMIAGGVGFGATFAALQDMLMRGASSSGEYDRFAQEMARYRQEAPIESLFVENLPGFLTGRPSLSPQLGARAIGAGMGGVFEGIGQYQTGDFDPLRLAGSIGIGALQAGPNTRIGQRAEDIGAMFGRGVTGRPSPMLPPATPDAARMGRPAPGAQPPSPNDLLINQARISAVEPPGPEPDPLAAMVRESERLRASLEAERQAQMRAPGGAVRRATPPAPPEVETAAALVAARTERELDELAASINRPTETPVGTPITEEPAATTLPMFKYDKEKRGEVRQDVPFDEVKGRLDDGWFSRNLGPFFEWDRRRNGLPPTDTHRAETTGEPPVETPGLPAEPPPVPGTSQTPSTPETPAAGQNTAPEIAELERRYGGKPKPDKNSPGWILPDGKEIWAGADHTSSAGEASRAAGKDFGMDFNANLQNTLDSGAVRVSRMGGRIAVDVGEGAKLTRDQVSAVARLAENARKEGVPFDYNIIDYTKTGIVAAKKNAVTDTTASKFMDDVYSRGMVDSSQPTASASAIPARASTRRVYTPTNRAVDVHYEVRDIDSLTVSHDPETFDPNPRANPELQTRPREDAASQEQIRNIENDVNPDRLFDSSETNSGAPIIFGSDVEVGHGRAMGLMRMYRNSREGAERYRQFVRDKAAEMGIEIPAGVRNPVLVRVRDTPVPEGRTRGEFVNEMGRDPGLERTEFEIAQTDSDTLLKSGILAKLNPDAAGGIGGDSNSEFHREFFTRVPASKNEWGGMGSKRGSLSSQGLRRIQNAVIASVYRDPEVVRRLIDTSENDRARTVGNALVETAPAMARARELGDTALDPTADITEAADILHRARRTKAPKDRDPIDYYLEQNVFGAGDMATRWAKAFAEAGNSKQQVKDLINAYIRRFEGVRKTEGGGLFGEETVTAERTGGATKEEAFDAAYREVFGGEEPAPAPAPKPEPAPAIDRKTRARKPKTETTNARRENVQQESNAEELQGGTGGRQADEAGVRNSEVVREEVLQGEEGGQEVRLSHTQADVDRGKRAKSEAMKKANDTISMTREFSVNGRKITATFDSPLQRDVYHYGRLLKRFLGDRFDTTFVNEFPPNSEALRKRITDVVGDSTAEQLHSLARNYDANIQGQVQIASAAGRTEIALGDFYRGDAASRARAIDSNAVSETARQEAPAPSKLEAIKAAAKEAEARRAERLRQAQSGENIRNASVMDPEELKDIALIAAGRAVEIGESLAAWTRQQYDQWVDYLEQTFGPNARAAALDIWNEMKQAFGEPNVVPPAAAGSTSPVVSQKYGIRQEDIEAASNRLGIAMPPRITEGWKAAYDRAYANYDVVLDELRASGVEYNQALNRTEVAVANIRYRELEQRVAEISTAAQGKTGQALMDAQAELAEVMREFDFLGAKLFTGASEAGRRLQFQRSFVEGPVDSYTIINRVRAATGGAISPEAQANIVKEALVARQVKEQIDQRVEKRAEAAEARVRKKLPRKEAISKNVLIPTEEVAINRKTRPPSRSRNFSRKVESMFGEEAAKEVDDAFASIRRALSNPGASALANQLLNDMLPGVVTVAKWYIKTEGRSFINFVKSARQTLKEQTKGLAKEEDIDAIPEDYFAGAWRQAGGDVQTFRQPGEGVQLPDQPRSGTSIPLRISPEGEVRGETPGTPRQLPDPTGRPAVQTTMEGRAEGGAERPRPNLPDVPVTRRAVQPGLAVENTEPGQAVDPNRPRPNLPDQPQSLPSVQTRISPEGEQRGVIDTNAPRPALPDVPVSTPVRTERMFDLSPAPPPATPKRAAEATGRAQGQAGRSLERIEDWFPGKDKEAAEDLVDVAVAEYAKGAKELEVFARRMKARFGDTISEPIIKDAMIEAARKYRQDYKQYEDIVRGLTDVVANETYRALSPWQKVGIKLQEMSDMVRSLVTAPDLSMAGRQGWVLAAANLTNPKTAKFAREAFTEQLKAFAREGVAEDVMDSLRPRMGLYNRAGLEITDWDQPNPFKREEGFESTKAENIPGIGRGIRASNRAAVTFLNKIRADNFDLIVNAMADAAGTTAGKLSDRQLRAVASFINDASGRGDLSDNMKSAGRFLSNFLFSPRFVASRFRLLARQVTDPAHLARALFAVARDKTPENKAELMGRYLISRTMLQYHLATAAVIGMTQIPRLFDRDDLAPDVETDPRSSSFMKLRYGQVVVDPNAGLAQTATFLARMGTGMVKSRSGNVRELSNEQYPYENRWDTLVSMVRSKLAPIPSTAVDLMAGQNFFGRDIKEGGIITSIAEGVGKDIKGGNLATADYVFTRNFIQMTIPDFLEVAKEYGYPSATAVAVLNLFGVSANAQIEFPRDTRKWDEKTARKAAVQAIVKRNEMAGYIAENQKIDKKTGKLLSHDQKVFRERQRFGNMYQRVKKDGLINLYKRNDALTDMAEFMAEKEGKGVKPTIRGLMEQYGEADTGEIIRARDALLSGRR